MAKSEDKDSGFSAWLSDKLNLLKIDETIYLNYILSILEGEESRDEKLDILKSILVDTGSSEEFIESQCNDILDKWQVTLTDAFKEKKTEKVIENVDEKLARLLESNVRFCDKTHTCEYTDEQLKIREAILSQYGQADDPDDDEYEKDENDVDLEKNTNVTSIHQAEKEKREKAKLENQKKKERDKLEREKQKSTQQEKKEARRKRAQKVEHHRK